MIESYCGEQNYSRLDLETVYSMMKTPPAPKEVILVLLAFTFLTPLIEFLRQAQCMPKFVLNIIGSTGTRKSVVSGYSEQHYSERIHLERRADLY